MASGNHTKGRPHLIGNQWRKGRPKPPGSGRPKVFAEPVNLTIKVEKVDKDFWQAEAAAFNMTVGEYIRSIMNNIERIERRLV